MKGEKYPEFVALTADDSFWGKHKNILFIGNWCKRFSKKKLWGSLNSSTMPSWVKSTKHVLNTIDDVEKIYTKFLKSLSDGLNNFHGTNHSKRYWKILIGPWLLHHINIFFDRYMTIKKAAKTHPNFTTIGLDKNCYSYPIETAHYISLSETDQYNLQIFTDIILSLGNNIVLKEKNIINNSEYKRENHALNQNLKNTIKTFLLKYLNKLSYFFYKDKIIVMNKIYLPFFKIIFLWIKSFGKIANYNFETRKLGLDSGMPNFKIRQKIEINIKTISEFEKILLKSLIDYVPLSFIENYSIIERSIPDFLPKSAKAIITQSFSYNEIFKQWLAKCVDKGALLIGLQHGGINNIFKRNQTEEHEVSICDKYFSWGSTSKKFSKKIVPLFSTKMINQKKIGSSNSLETILFCSTSFPRYLNRFWLGVCNNYNYEQYISLQFRFVDSVNYKDKILIRPFMDDYGWDYYERWNARYPSIVINNKNLFMHELEKCKVFICDNIQTVWLESLFVNKPTIMYLDIDKYCFTDKTKYYIDQLKSVKIMHDTPEAAAKTLNNVYSDINKWWENSELQQVRASFCNFFINEPDYALTSFLNLSKNIFD